MDAAQAMVPLSPAITDGVFQIAPHDLTFLHLSRYSIAQWWMKAAPLGLSGALQPFVEALLEALDHDRVTDADVRVKGSSADFFSSLLKPMPTARAEWESIFEESYSGRPTSAELASIDQRWMEWLSGRTPPSRRPFDSLFYLGVQRDPSDIDLQLSSSDATERAAASHKPEASVAFRHPKFDFVRDEFAQLALPWTFRFAELESTRLDRPINVKLFDGTGPPDKSASSPVSAHFQATDWKLA